MRVTFAVCLCLCLVCLSVCALGFVCLFVFVCIRFILRDTEDKQRRRMGFAGGGINGCYYITMFLMGLEQQCWWSVVCGAHVPLVGTVIVRVVDKEERREEKALFSACGGERETDGKTVRISVNLAH